MAEAEDHAAALGQRSLHVGGANHLVAIEAGAPEGRLPQALLHEPAAGDGLDLPCQARPGHNRLRCRPSLSQLRGLEPAVEPPQQLRGEHLHRKGDAAAQRVEQPRGAAVEGQLEAWKRLFGAQQPPPQASIQGWADAPVG